MQMELIRKKRNGYALLFAASVCLTVWLGSSLMTQVAYAFAAASITSFLFLVRQSRLLYDATLIWDNRILEVPSTLISTTACTKCAKDTEETIISAFGMLIGSKIYRWGLDGVQGTRLIAARIDKERICLTFGNATHAMQVELLHGMTRKQLVLDTARKLLYETGVTADISGW